MVSTQEQEQERKSGDENRPSSSHLDAVREEAPQRPELQGMSQLGHALLMHLQIYSEQGTAPALMELTVTK